MNVERQGVLRSEPGITSGEHQEAPHQKSRTDDRNERQTDFADGNRTPQPAAACARCQSASGFPERRWIRVQLERRCDAEQKLVTGLAPSVAREHDAIDADGDLLAAGARR